MEAIIYRFKTEATFFFLSDNVNEQGNNMKVFSFYMLLKYMKTNISHTVYVCMLSD